MNTQRKPFTKPLECESLESREMMAAGAIGASLAHQEIRVQLLHAEQHVARPVVDKFAIKLPANVASGETAAKSAAATPTIATPAIAATIAAPTLRTDQLAASLTTLVASTIPVAQGRQQFVLQAVNKQNVSDTTLAKADGLAVRITWSLLEPTNNKYNWTFLDQQMARADRMGKPVQLILLAGNDAPSWLSGMGVQVVSGIPQPWATTTQAQYKELATAIASHLRQTGTLDRVTHVFTPGAESAEWHFDNAPGFYTQSGYSDANMVAGQVGFAKTLAVAFPQSIVVATIGDHNRAWTGTAIAQLKSELRGQIGFQMNSLSAKTSTSYLGYTRIRDAAAQGYHAGFQTVSPSSNTTRFGGTYDQMYAKFTATKAQWIQDYPGDIR